MKLSQQKSIFSSLVGRLALPALAVLSITAGIVAGTIFRTNHKDSSAASANITVRDNDQTIEQDQSTREIIITRTSIVTVKNPEANYGYTLSAKLTTTIPNATVTIASPTSTDCPTDTPCPLNTSTPITIFTTTDNTATETNGDTTAFTVSIAIPAGTLVSDYVMDIEYSETQNPLASMQDFTTEKCGALAIGSTINLRDARDDKVYRIRKMKDERCWMLENLAYDINSAKAEGKPVFNPSAQLITNGTASVSSVAQYISNTGYQTAAGDTTYLYNWCAALGDISENCYASADAPALHTAAGGFIGSGTATDQFGVVGICPAPFRLPKGGPESSPASTPASTANEFVKLDIKLGGSGINRSNANTYPFFVGTASDGSNWAGALGGFYEGSLIDQGARGRWWSSTAQASTRAYSMVFYSPNGVDPASNNVGTKSRAFAIRCLL